MTLFPDNCATQRIFFPDCQIQIKIVKRFVYFSNLKNTNFIFLLQIVIHFFRHLFIMKV